MENYINKNINTEIKWSREIVHKPKNKKRPLGKINGLYILDKKQKSEDSPNGFCGSIELQSDGSLEIWTNGKYQFIKPEIAEKLILELMERLYELLNQNW